MLSIIHVKTQFPVETQVSPKDVKEKLNYWKKFGMSGEYTTKKEKFQKRD